MKFLLKKILLAFMALLFTTSAISAWNGLIAENGDYITLDKWNQLVASVGGGASPYITTSAVVNLSPSTTANITIAGDNFEPDSSISIPGFDGTINSISNTSPYELVANITSGVALTTYDIIISNGGKTSASWSGNGSNLLTIIPPVFGTGIAGTYGEGFEAVSLGSWVDSPGIGKAFTIQQGTTGSSGTGPSGPSSGTYYVYAETSTAAPAGSPNIVFAIETTDFRKADSVSFDYHMAGGDIGVLEVQTLSNGIWTTRYTLAGSQQANEAAAWINTGLIDLSGFPVESIKILYTSGSSWAGDASIDNVSIISVN